MRRSWGSSRESNAMFFIVVQARKWIVYQIWLDSMIVTSGNSSARIPLGVVDVCFCFPDQSYPSQH